MAAVIQEAVEISLMQVKFLSVAKWSPLPEPAFIEMSRYHPENRLT